MSSNHSLSCRVFDNIVYVLISLPSHSIWSSLIAHSVGSGLCRGAQIMTLVSFRRHKTAKWSCEIWTTASGVDEGSSLQEMLPLVDCLDLQDQALSHSSWTLTLKMYSLDLQDQALSHSSRNLTLKMYSLDLQDQALSHSFWTAWPWRCTAWIFRIRHCPTLPGPWSWRCTPWIFRIVHCPILSGPLDPEDALPGSSGSGIVPIFMEFVTLKMQILLCSKRR